MAGIDSAPWNNDSADPAGRGVVGAGGPAVRRAGETGDRCWCALRIVRGPAGTVALVSTSWHEDPRVMSWSGTHTARSW